MRKVVVWTLTLALAGCAVRLGGPAPVEYETAAVRFDAATTPSQAAAQLKELGTDLGLIMTPRDSVWIRELAQQMQLVSTRPGRINDMTVAFLATKPEGDTTLTLTVADGGRMQMHDALYKIDKTRLLDLMTVVIEPGTSARGAVRRLLEYLSSDVPHDAVAALAIQSPSPAVADSVAELTRSVWGDAWECTESGRKGEKAPPMIFRLFYFPNARVRCDEAHQLNGGAGTAAQLIVGR